MKKRWMGQVVGLTVSQAQVASLDCVKATTRVEKMICTDALGTDSDHKRDVSGCLLGGFLATALTADFVTNVSQTNLYKEAA